MKIVPTLLLVLASASICFQARAADPLPAVTMAPHPTIWAARPTLAQVHQAGPGGARAVLRCRVDAAGSLSTCAIVAETPSASGFGAALVAMAPLYRLKPEVLDTATVEGTITFVESTFAVDAASDWLRKPNAHDMAVVWPRAALRKGVNGQAILNCMVSTQGALFDCAVTRETPAGLGFGQAAVALTPQFLMTPPTFRGQPAQAIINIPINFKANGRAYNPAFTPAVVSAAMAWPKAPTYADVAAVYPKAAAAAHLAGRATLLCGFDIFGNLDACRTIAEEPKGQGFGNAAHLLTRRFQAEKKTPNGRPIGQAELEIPFVFDPAVLTAVQPAVGKAQWVALPTPAQTQAAFSGLAKTDNTAAHASLECTVEPGGRLSACAVIAETPVGHGVGPAALTLAGQFRVSTWTLEGLPTVGGRIRVPIRLEGGATAPAP